jgi:hypothetical protein
MPGGKPIYIFVNWTSGNSTPEYQKYHNVYFFLTDHLHLFLDTKDTYYAVYLKCRIGSWWNVSFNINIVNRFCKPFQSLSTLMAYVRGPFLTSPLGANFDPQGQSCPPGVSLSPRGEVIPRGVKLSVRPSILLNNKECSPLGVNKGVNFTPRGRISPLGAKFTPRGEIHPWGPGVNLRMALWCR